MKGNFEWIKLDLSDPVAVAKCISSLHPIAIRALVLSAVHYGEGGRHPAADTSAKEWEQVIATNCVGHCVLISSLLNSLISASPGIIINLSSDVALLPASGRSAYAASKSGLHAMLRAVAEEYPIDKLRVYQLVPTFQIDTEGIRRRRPNDFDFSSYAHPAIIARIVDKILSPSGAGIAPGTYLVRADGTIALRPEITEL